MMVRKNSYARVITSFFAAAVYFFLYLPILILIIFSLSSSQNSFSFDLLTLKWYLELFNSPVIWDAFKNSLIVATGSAFLSLVLGLLFVFYSSYARLNQMVLTFYGNLMVPEIILSVSLLAFFTFFAVPLGLLTLIVGHTILGLGYVVPLLWTRFQEIDQSIIEASLDLGATIHQTFFKIVIPLLLPALIAAGLLVFIVSLDDFLLSFFCSGSSAQTLSLYIFAMIRTGVSPTLNALSTLLFLVSSLLILALGFSSVRTKLF